MCHYVVPMPRSGIIKCLTGILSDDLNDGHCSALETSRHNIGTETRTGRIYEYYARRIIRTRAIPKHMEGKKQMKKPVTRHCTPFVTALVLLLIVMASAMAVPAAAG